MILMLMKVKKRERMSEIIRNNDLLMYGISVRRRALTPNGVRRSR